MASSPQSPPPPPPPRASSSPLSPPPTCSPGDNSSVVAVVSPCAACKILRRRCVDKCVLAPYFPPTDPYKFTIAHRVFGAANIIKFLQELPDSQRADAASSMVYEAHARLRDPVYGCAGAICQLQKQIVELKTELAKTQAEAVNVQCQNSNLISLICMEMTKIHQAGDTTSHCTDAALAQQHTVDTSCFLDESSLGCCSSGWEPFWN